MGKSITFLLFALLASGPAWGQVYGRSYFWRNDGFYIQSLPETPPPNYYYPTCNNCSPVTPANNMSPRVKESDYFDYSEKYNAHQNVSKPFNESPE